MLADLEEKLIQLQAEMKQRGKYESRLHELESELNSQNVKLAELKKKLDKEELDVKKIESFSLLSIWYAFLGTKSMRLSEEKEEAYRAQYDYKLVYENTKSLEQEMTDVKQKIEALNYLEPELAELLRQKEEYIIQGNGVLSEEIISINNQMINIKSNNKEIHEALQAGRVVLNSLKEIHEALKKADGWATWDMFGGGLLTDMIKHSHIDQAKIGIDRLKASANRFNKELRDINLTLNIEVNISDTLKFIDFFFDGIFSSIAVHNRISEAINHTRKAFNDVESLLKTLETKMNTNNIKLNELNDKKKKLLSGVN